MRQTPKEKKLVSSFTATKRELEILNALAQDLKVSKSKVIVMGVLFLEGIRHKANIQGKAKDFERLAI